MFAHYLVLLPLACSLQCYDFVDEQIGGKILQGVKKQVNCTNPEFCLSVYKEDGEGNIYSALCANNAYSEESCETVGCFKSHSNGYSVKKCCCNTAYCNSTWSRGFFDLNLIVLFLMAATV